MSLMGCVITQFRGNPRAPHDMVTLVPVMQLEVILWHHRTLWVNLHIAKGWQPYWKRCSLGKGELSEDLMPSEAAIPSWGDDLCSLEISYNSRRPPGLTLWLETLHIK